MAHKLIGMGFKHVYVLRGGYLEWCKDGLPIEKKWTINQECVKCHESATPGIVSDWKLSKHSKAEVTCSVCHGESHVSQDDVEKALPVPPERCGMCHPLQLEQFKEGKHALAWAAMKAMPTFHWRHMASLERTEGCASCHRIGLKSEADLKALGKKHAGYGMSSCDVCHTRHTFFKKEAEQPQACESCHMGYDDPQWQMYSGSKHGIRYLLKQNGTLPESIAAPTCQTCHMEEGNHEVRTAWGFLGLRLGMHGDKEWSKASNTILQAFGISRLHGRPSTRLDLLKRTDTLRLTREDWLKERKKMVEACSQCHTVTFAERNLKKGDSMIRRSDIIMAKAIRIVAGLYRDGILKKPKDYTHPFPDFLTPLEEPRPIERKLWRMFGDYRMKAFQGAFHDNPNYAYWYGWTELQRTLSEIKEMAENLRQKAGKGKGRPHG